MIHEINHQQQSKNALMNIMIQLLWYEVTTIYSILIILLETLQLHRTSMQLATCIKEAEDTLYQFLWIKDSKLEVE